MTRALALLLTLLVALAAVADDQPYLVRDLPGVTVSDSMAFFQPFWTTLGNTSWFAAFVDSQTMELFRSDGTTPGTVRVTNGVGSPDRDYAGPFLGTIHGKLVYGGRDAGGVGLFALDTAGGEPVLLMRVPTQHLTNGVVYHGTLYFTARKTDGSEHELWRTDGTPAGTEMIDLLPGEQGTFHLSHEWRLFIAGDWMFFFGTTSRGAGLHRTDGTLANTTLVLPLSPNGGLAGLRTIVVHGDRLLFYLSRSDETQDSIWTSDGTAAGTSSIVLIPGLDSIGTLGGNLFFLNERRQIWVTDGTKAGTRETDILAAQNLSFHGGGVVGNQLYFFASSFQKETLYVTGGTAATTQAIMDVKHTGAEGRDGFVIGDQFYFRNDDGIHGSELWATDGTNTRMVSDINPGYRNAIEASRPAAVRPDGTAIFVAKGIDTGREPWITDGTTAGTRLLANLAAEDPRHGSSPHFLQTSGGKLFFIATLTGGQALGVSDGTEAGTTANLTDVNWAIGETAAAGDRYFFATSVAPFGLYATDGTVAGTNGIFEGRITPRPFRNGVLFFGDEAIRFTDGTLAGTRMVRHFGPPQPFAPSIVPTGDVAWIFTTESIWKTDGTEAGTVEIVPSEPRKAYLGGVIRAGSTFYLFESRSSDSGPRLWRSDGTSAGTRVVKTLSFESPRFIGATDHLVFFVINGTLYRSDGTDAGTIALNTVTIPCSSAVLGDALIFTTTTSNALTVWRSDGSVSGTTKLATINVGNSLVFCSAIAARRHAVYFSGWDAAHGFEPWVTDGTVAGTKMLADLYPGQTSSLPFELTSVGSRVFFSADSPTTGRELWAIGTEAAPRRRAVGFH
ncbi:MAG TPA: hypothetical protein VMU84_17760 [Thermoanaerobaculia bacterium]|nr:hypothetical protein [Thermoanaerobaculia bacterium]